MLFMFAFGVVVGGVLVHVCSLIRLPTGVLDSTYIIQVQKQRLKGG